jgi:hypothetical protein
MREPLMEAIWVATEIRAGGVYARSALPIHVFDNEAVTGREPDAG